MRKLLQLYKRTAFLTLMLLGLMGTKAYADHIAAVDLYADYIGADSTNMKYRVTLVVYKNCSGITTLGATQTITTNSVLGGFNFTRALPQFGTTDTLDQLCENLGIPNRCRSAASTFPGYERKTYRDTITVPIRSTDLKFSWSLCCRSGASGNILPATANFYIECSVNNVARFNNSTPHYTIIPIPYICANQATQFLSGPIDPDMDSMVTTLINPMLGAAGGMTYGPAPYSLANPVNSVVPFTVNPVNAVASFTAPGTGNYVLAFRTFEYDKTTGQQVGYISRDVQISVVPCAAPAPTIDPAPRNIVNGNIIQPGNILLICPNVKTSFDVVASSTSGLNVIKLTADNGVTAPGSTFIQGPSVNGQATGAFAWTPTTADIGDHVVTFVAEDTTCTIGQPIKLKNYQIVTIRVLPGLFAGPDKKICPLGDNPVTISVSGPQTNIYKWEKLGGGNAEFIDCLNCPNVKVTPPYDYTYVVSSADPMFTCKKSDTVVVTVDNSNGIAATQDPLVVCRPGYVHLNADAVGLPPLENLPCGIINPQNCTTPALMVVGATGNVGSIPSNTPLYSAEKYSKYQFIVTKDELKNAGVFSGTLRSIAFKHNNPTVISGSALANVRISLKCTRNSRYPNIITNAEFETGATTVVNVPGLVLVANDWNEIPFTTPYNWDTTQNLLVDICIGNATFVPTAAGFDPIDMVPGQAIQRTSATVDVCAGNSTNISSYSQKPAVRFSYCEAPSLPFDYRWAPGTYLSDSNVQSPIAYVPRSGKYAVFTRGRNGCLVRDSLTIIVPVHNLSLTADTSVCVFQPAPLFATGASAGYRWYENGFNTPTTLSCNDCASPIATPVVPGDITYTVVFLDTADCYDTMQVKVHAYTLPVVTISNRDTTIKFGQSVRLIVNGANRYTWTPVGSLTDPNIPNPIASPTVTTRYIVFGLNQYNCSSSDTVTVKVDNRDNLLIPSGFTPNFDGKNDYFRIVNVTFQKLMEFRVFNRWGQEVFSTTDPMKGWDGTWKGVAQDVGNYAYIIRVAYPDGYVETYKGDVSLIR